MAKFFLFFALNFELLLISETLGILCAGLHRNELVGMIILATFYVPLLMFTGFIQVGPTSSSLRKPFIQRDRFGKLIAWGHGAYIVCPCICPGRAQRPGPRKRVSCHLRAEHGL